jgi:hypothetical protein
MNLTKILAELRSERELLDNTITTLQNLVQTTGAGGKARGDMEDRQPSEVKRRGRPPGAKNKSREMTSAG